MSDRADARSPLQGLNAAEVAERVRLGETNAGGVRGSRSVGEILRSNVFTLFNGLLAVLLVAILVWGQPRDALFGVVLVLNMAIGIVQELRAKRTLDRLSVVAAPRARVVRDGVTREIGVHDVVLGDVLELRRGDQVVVDGTLLSADGLEVDESLLTGEARPAPKAMGDTLMSGSFCVAGTGLMRAHAVGAAAYAQRLAAEAKHFRRVPSELRRTTDTILRWTTIAMVPVAVLLVATGWRHAHDPRTFVPGTVAALVGMVPQGLVLLTSIALAVSVVRLARRHALVEELSAVELLARVDVVCLDKTGTLTEPEVEVTQVQTLADDEQTVRAALGALAALEPEDARNATSRSLAAAFPAPDGWRRRSAVPFSSPRKWAAADFGEHGVWVHGAADVLLPRGDAVRESADRAAAAGARVVLLARASSLPGSGSAPPTGLTAAALVSLEERIRGDAAETLAFFGREGVSLKVISGDAAATVAAVARRAGLAIQGDPVDADCLPTDPDELSRTAEAHTVFGRVTPEQKRDLVAALQRRGHVVAMTGDGVNDTLALKAADLGIAMGAGAPAARAVADLVLLDSRFASIPAVVAEGRRVMSNVERVANLFVTKTVYAALLAVGVGLFAAGYPLLPRHFTLIDAFTIGIPGFFLALAPAATRYRPGLLKRVMRFTVVCGGVMALAGAGVYAWALAAGGGAASVGPARTAAVVVLLLVGLWVLFELSRPLTRGRAALIAAMIAGVALVFVLPAVRSFFALPLAPGGATLVVAAVAAASFASIDVVLRLVGWRPVHEEAKAS